MMEISKIKCESTAEDVSLRVRNTRKEIQDLKTELEMLISSGINASKVATQDTEFTSQDLIKSDQVTDTCTAEAQHPSKFMTGVQKLEALGDIQDRLNVKSEEAVTCKIMEKPVGANKANPESGVCKRTKSYNRAETREWMKKRRERVTDDLRAKVKESQATIDIKREKLRQLHEKCQLIVSTNVQKRSRCKSVEPISSQPLVSRSKSCDPLTTNIHAKSGVGNVESHCTKPSIKPASGKKSCINTQASSIQNVNIKSNSNPALSSRPPYHKFNPKCTDLKKKTNVSNIKAHGKCSPGSKQKNYETGSVSKLISKFENYSDENLLSVPQQPLSNRYTDSKDLKASRVEFEKEPYPISTSEKPFNTNREKNQTKPRVTQNRSKTQQPSFVKHDSGLADKATSVSESQIVNSKKIQSSRTKNENKNDVVSAKIKSGLNAPIKSGNDAKDKTIRNAITVRQLNNKFFELAPHLSDEKKTDSVLQQPNHTLQSSEGSQDNILKSKKSELAIMTDSCDRVTKDTQTVDIGYKLQESPWLQVPNNLNFINTVKEKLKSVIQSPGYLKDVGVQSSLIEHHLQETNYNTCASQIKRDLLKDDFTDAGSPKDDGKNTAGTNKKSCNEKKSDLNSFLSHKLLDIRSSNSLQNIPPVSEKKKIPLKFTSQSDIISTIKTATTDSDYDTSKNIPDISSELSLVHKQKLKTSAIPENKSIDLEIDMNQLKDLNLKTKNLSYVKDSNRQKDDKKSLLSVPGSNNVSKEEINSQELKSRSVKEIYTNTSIFSFQDNSKSHEDIITLDKTSQSANKQFTDNKRLSSKDSKSLIQNSITIRSNSGYSIDFNSLKDSSSYKSSNDDLNSTIKSSVNTVKHSKSSSSNRMNSSVKHIDKDPVVQVSERNTNELSQLKVDDNSNYSSAQNSSSNQVGKRSQLSSHGTAENKSRSERSVHTRSSIEILTEYSNGQTSVPKKITVRNTDTHEDIAAPLKEPSLRLEVDSVSVKSSTDKGKLFKTLSLSAGGIQNNDAQIKSNEIHLKFEAEVHLLNDFNESLKSFMAVEKAFESLKEKNGLTSPQTNHQTRDTQTSLQAKTPITSKISEATEHLDSTQKQMSGINYSRGSEIIDDLSTAPLERTGNGSKNNEDTFMSTTGLTGFELSNLNNSLESFVEDTRLSVSTSNIENINGSSISNISLKMFEQLIKDEDIRIENLKTIIRIREKSLLDRTKTELALLEIQRKHLKETGQLDKVSDIRKKQRGIILKHQHERNEMQKLKQIQKTASKERKLILRQQSNFIKSQLSTNNMLSKIKVSTPRQNRRSSGPLRVIKSHNEVEITSDLTTSRKSSVTEEILSIASHTSVASSSEETAYDVESYPHQQIAEESVVDRSLSHVKQALLMREAALEKRRKAAEELLKWHQRLLEEERKISELESAADIVINQIPSTTTVDKDAQKFPLKGSQLNQLLHNMTGREDKEYLDDEMYMMSQTALEQFCRNSKDLGRNSVNKRSDKVSDMYKAKSESINISVSSVNDIPETSCTESVHTEVTSQVDIQSVVSDNVDNVYTSDFDNDSIKSSSEKQNELNRISSISELIDNFSKIKDEISLLSRKTERNMSQINQDDDTGSNLHKDSGSSTSVVSTQLFTDDEKSNQMKTHSESISATIQSQLSPVSKEKGVSEHMKLKEGESSQKESSEVLTDIKDTTPSSKEGSGDDKLVTKERRSTHTSPVSSSSLNSVVSSELSHNKINAPEKNLTTDGVIPSSELIKSDSLTASGNKESTSNKNELLPAAESTISVITDKVPSSVVPVEEDNVTSIENKFLETVEKSLSIVNSLGKNVEDNTQASNDLLSLESSIKTRSGVSKDLKGIDVVDSVENISPLEDIEVSSKVSDISEIKSQHVLSQHSGITSGSIGKSREGTTVSSNKKYFSKSETPISTDSIKRTPSEDASHRTSSNSYEMTPKSDRLSDTNFSKSTSEPVADEIAQNIDIHVTPSESVKYETPSVLNDTPNIEVSDNLSTVHGNTCNLKSKEITSQSENESIKSELQNLDVDLKLKLEVSDVLSDRSERQESEIQEEVNRTQSGSTQQDVESLEAHTKSESKTEMSVPYKTLTAVAQEIEPECQEIIKEAEALSVQDELENHNVDITSKESDTSDYASEIAPENVTSTGISIFQTKSDIADHTLHEVDNTSIQSEINLKSDSIPFSSQLPTNDKSLEEKIDSPASTVILNENEDSIDTESSEDLEDLSDDVESRKSRQSRSSSNSTPERRTEEHITDKTILANVEEPVTDKSFNVENSKVEASIDSEISVLEEAKERLQSEANTVGSLSVSEHFESEAENIPVTTISNLSTKDKHIDVKRRVSEILAEANQGSRGDKSPRLQDLYVTAYDIISPANSPETGSPEHKTTQSLVAENIFGDEAKELMIKQLAIEQEIKQIEEQQKEHIPYVFMREIPNKPPPPYTPPTPQQSSPTVLPTDVADIQEVTSYAANVLHKAYLNKNLSNVRLKECNFKLVSQRNISKSCCELLFDLCTELATDHYKQFDEPEGPSWLRIVKKPQMTLMKPFDAQALERYMNKKLKELFGFEKPGIRESAIIKWSRKKRDYVDEIILLESQSEDPEWINYEKDEVLVKDELTNDLMNMLLSETADVFSKLISKQTFTH